MVSEESQRCSLQQVYQDTVAGRVAEGAALLLCSKVEASVVLASPVLRHSYQVFDNDFSFFHVWLILFLA